MDEKKKCFIVTPIGNEDSEMRRHIDGIIDQAIEPALKEKFEIKVAHREYEIGSINDRVVRNVYESDLVIANLTKLNPNVMYELAIRYSFAKPAIVIAEKGTLLPFDVTTENTIFYINDPQGANDLKNSIIKFEKGIDYSEQTFGPVYSAINKIPLYDKIESGEDVSDANLTKYLVERLDSIENTLYSNIKYNNRKIILNIRFNTDLIRNSENEFKKDISEIISAYKNVLKVRYVISGFDISLDTDMENIHTYDLASDIRTLMDRYGVDDYDINTIRG